MAIFILPLLLVFLGYLIGKYYGERTISNLIEETFTDLEQEILEYQKWVANGEKLNEIPAPKFGLMSWHYPPDKYFTMKQALGERIKKVSKPSRIVLKNPPTA